MAHARRAGRSRSIRSMAAANISPSASPKSPTTSSRSRSFAAGEIVPGLQVLDAVQNGTVEMGNTALVLLLRQGRGLHVRHRAAVRRQHPQMNAWLRFGERPEPAERAVCKVQLHRLRGRQHRRADGRLVPQGDQDRRRPQGPEDAHRRLRRHHPAEGRRGAAAARRRATSIRRWRRARSTPPNGSARTTTRSSAS